MSISYSSFEATKKVADNKRDFEDTFYHNRLPGLVAFWSSIHKLAHHDSPEVLRRSLTPLLVGGIDYIGVAQDNCKDVVAHILAAKGLVIEIHVKEELHKTGIATKLLEEYKAVRADKYEHLTASWDGQRDDLVKLALKAGFDVTSAYDEVYHSLIKTTAQTPYNNKCYHKILDDMDRGYIDFRGDHAVVDGHFNLEQLEALLHIARKELKDGK